MSFHIVGGVTAALVAVALAVVLVGPRYFIRSVRKSINQAKRRGE